MKTRIITVLLAMALPLCAQDAPKDTAKHVFYEAFWLEKGARDYSGASELYTKFLTMAPKHKLARQAARLQFGLLNKTGQTKARDAFREKYKNLLGDAAAPQAPRGGDVRPGEQGENPRRRGEQGENPRGRGEQGENPRGRGEQGENPRRRGEQGENPRGRGTGTPEEMAARIAQIEKDLAKAKEAGDEEQVARLTRNLERMKRFAEGGGRTGAGGRTGRTGRTPQKPVTEMNEEELTQFKSRIERMASLIDRMSERMGEEEAKAAKANFAALKKALDEGKLEAAQKAYDKMRAAFPRRGGRGGAGGEGRTGGGRGGAGGGRTGGGTGGGGGGGGR